MDYDGKRVLAEQRRSVAESSTRRGHDRRRFVSATPPAKSLVDVRAGELGEAVLDAKRQRASVVALRIDVGHGANER